MVKIGSGGNVYSF